MRQDGRLIGVAALIAPRVGLARVWMSAYAALPAVAFDRDAAPEALAALLALLAERTRLAGLRLAVGRGGRRATRRRCAALALPRRSPGGRARAALRLAGAAAFDAGLDPKRRNTKWARQRRRLGGSDGGRRRRRRIEAFFEVERKRLERARAARRSPTIPRASPSPAPRSRAFASAGRLDALALRLDGAADRRRPRADRRRPRVLLEDRL